MQTGKPSRPPRRGPDLWVCHLGTVPYTVALRMQEHVRSRRQAGELPDVLLLLEHPPVYTRGRRAGAGELLFGEAFYRERGIDVVDCDRGGRITYHGPGQLVGYPIMAVDDVIAHVRTMEQAIVDALAGLAIEAHGRADDGPDFTGVWVGPRKIASIGVHVQRGVSTHGFAVNVENDLEPFGWVVACGLQGVAMTSVALESAGEAPDLPSRASEAAAPRGVSRAAPPTWKRSSCFRKRVADAFCAAHGRRQRLVGPGALGIAEIAGGPARAEPAPIREIAVTA